MQRWIGPTDQLIGAEREQGAFYGACASGTRCESVSSKNASLIGAGPHKEKPTARWKLPATSNRGTFCFSRPIYVDGSSVPRWLEFGLLKTDQTLWVEIFEN